MVMNRITSSLMNQQALYYLNNNLATLSTTQQKLSSGQNVNQPSDDPIALTQILSVTNTINMDTRFSSNIQGAVSENNAADSAMSSIVNLVQRVQEITTQAANFTNNQNGRTAIAQEVDQIINQIVQIGNTQINGKYIFGGAKTDIPPFTRTVDNITYNGTPPTGNWQRNVEISKGVQVTTNINGENLLGQVTVTTAGPPLPPTFSAGSQGLFQTLINLKQDLQAGGAPNQLSEISARLDNLTTDMNTVLNQQTILGAVGNRLNLTQGRLQDRNTILTQQYSSLQNINMPQTISNLNFQQNVLQASLAVSARVLQTSILNYLQL